MTDEERIRIFDSRGRAYKEAFQLFLDHTDQKRNARRWLQRECGDLPRSMSGGGGRRSPHSRRDPRLHAGNDAAEFVLQIGTGLDIS